MSSAETVGIQKRGTFYGRPSRQNILQANVAFIANGNWIQNQSHMILMLLQSLSYGLVPEM